MVQAILFDMDGVLLDSERAAFELLRKTLLSKGVEIPLEKLLDFYVGQNSNAIYADLIQRYQFGLTVEAFRREHRRLSGNYYADGDLQCMPGLVPFLKSLQGKMMKMAVVSSTSSENVLMALNRLSLTAYFDAIVCGDHVAAPKPSPEGYLKAAAYLHLNPEQCLAVEDSPTGIQAAKNAGIRVIGYKGSEHTQDTAAADWEARSYGEVSATASALIT